MNLPQRGLLQSAITWTLLCLSPLALAAGQTCHLSGISTGDLPNTFTGRWRTHDDLKHHIQTLRGTIQSNTGNARLKGRCIGLKSGDRICSFTLRYRHEQASGARYDYTGTLHDQTLQGSWRYSTYADKHGDFTAQLTQCLPQ